MENLAQILAQEVRKYASNGWGMKLRLFPILDNQNHNYSVIAVENPRGSSLFPETPVAIVIFARLVEDKVIIEEDNTDKPLLDALLQQSVPREQIILAYKGEAIPDGERSLEFPQP